MRLRLSLGLAATALLVYGAVLAARIGAFDDIAALTEVNLAAAAALVFVGLVVWHRYPDNRVGILMTALGFNLQLLFLVYSRTDALWTLGMVLQGTHIGLTTHLLLAYPSGRLEHHGRLLVGIAYVGLFVTNLVRLLTWNPERPGLWNGDGTFALPNTLLLVADAPRIADLAEKASRFIQFGVLVALAAALILRWARSSPLRRRLTAAVVVPGAAWAIRMGLGAPLDQWGRSLLIKNGSYTWLYYALSFAGFGLLLLVALAVLYVGLLRQRLARAGVADLVVELDAPAGSERLEEALRRSLGDPDAEVLFWREPGGWVGPDGASATLPPEVDGDRAVTVVARQGRQVAAIVHDPALRSEPALVEAATAAASLALENERLHALTLAQLSEVRSSRARIVAAADGARRRIERDLHDGAQQRLVSLALALRRARAQLSHATPAALDAQLQALDAGMHHALAELRDLAHGIHPAALTEQGLAGALASLADDAPLPVVVSAVPSGRLPAAVEATAWFVASEAVANAAKHAAATHVSIAARLHGDELELEVADDGVGRADVDRGSGLLGLRDRVEALDGSLAIDSPVGGGTRLRARIPLGDRS